MLDLKSQAGLCLQNKGHLYAIEIQFKTLLKEARRKATPKVTQQMVADHLGVSTQAVSGWERGKAVPETEKIFPLAAFLHIDASTLLASLNGPTDAAPQHNAHIHGPVTLTGRIPAYGHARGGRDGQFVLNGNKIADIVAPPSLANVRDAYAVYVAGESMEPRYFAGEVVYVNPGIPVRRGDFCVAQIQSGEDSAPLAFVKRFISRDAKRLRLEQLNPKKYLDFQDSKVVSVHRIVMGGDG